jgi:cell division protein FtsL
MKKNIQSYKRENRILYIVLVLLVVGFIYVFINNRAVVKEKEENLAQNIALQGDFDNLMKEYEQVKIDNETLTDQLTERDSVIMANADEIKKLIASQADYRKIQKKLALLRNITQEYVSRIDSLIVVNQQLTEENEYIKEEVVKEKKKSAQLSQDKKDLESKVTVGSSLMAYNVLASTYRLKSNGDEQETDRSAKIKRIKITFTLSENKIAEAGEKTIFACIIRPDGVVMTPGNNELYTFELDGKQEPFSISRNVSYNNKAVNIVMLWDRKDVSQPAMIGAYTVVLYLDGGEIGRTSFNVKK